MFEQCKKYGPKEWAQVVFMILILCAVGYLIIYSVYRMTAYNNSSLLMFAIAMFGVGCTAFWFVISHVEIVLTEEHLVRITERLDKIIEKIEKE